MYNKERKEEFIHYREEDAIISTNISVAFEQAAFFEEKLGLDICDWNSTQIISFLKYMSTPKVQTLIMMVNHLKIYTDWCISNHLSEDYQNHFCEIDSKIMCQCIDFKKFEQLIIKSREDLLRDLAILPNYSDRYIFLATYEGIPRTDIIEGRFEDLDEENSTLTISDKVYEISADLCQIIIAASNQNDFTSNVNQDISYSYINDGYILRFARRTQIKGGNRVNLYDRRFRECASYMGWNPQLTIKDLAESGRMDFIRKIMKENNLSAEAAVKAPWREVHQKKYGKVQNIYTYMETYGKYI
jgi:hypothetical protein